MRKLLASPSLQTGSRQGQKKISVNAKQKNYESKAIGEGGGRGACGLYFDVPIRPW